MKEDKKDVKNGLTIVGGQPSPESNSFISSNIERLLIKAASDEKIKEALLSKNIPESKEFPLTFIDRKILDSATPSMLNNMIEKFINHKTSRRNFLKTAAASAALLSGALIAAPALAISPPGGARPQPPVLTEEIGPDGGTIKYDYTGLKVVIPPKAVDKTVNVAVTVTILPGPSPENVFFSGEVYQFLPDNITFLKSISIYFPSSVTENIKAYVWNKNKWKALPVEFSENYAILKTKNLGIYTIGYEQNIEIPSPTRGIDIDY